MAIFCCKNCQCEWAFLVSVPAVVEVKHFGGEKIDFFSLVVIRN
jgi:hypothetical protein